MRRIYTLPLSALIACGPLAPPQDATTAASSDTGDTTDPGPSPTTTTPEPITTTTTLDPTTLDLTTGVPTTDAVPFIMKPDGGPIECDVFAQDCDPGQKCTAWAEGGGGAWNATKCVDVTGDGAPGEPCAAIGGGVSGMDDLRPREPCAGMSTPRIRAPASPCVPAPRTLPCVHRNRPVHSSSEILNLCTSHLRPAPPGLPGRRSLHPQRRGIHLRPPTPRARWAPSTTPANSPTLATRASSASTPPMPRAPASKAPRAAASPSAYSRAPPAQTPTNNASNGSTP
jgi:hypothetical protein